jgi:basic membrane lipoprotein Med (substrate-binding protein (PBP1-ABC) superfamily)
MNKRFFKWTPLLILATVVLFIAAACGKSATTSTPGGGGSSAATTPVLKVALIAPSATNDMAFTQSMFDALQRLKAAYNLQIAVSDNKFVVDDAANAIRTYASQGYDLVIAHGSQYGGSIEQIAPKFPNVSFAWGTAGDTFGLQNVFAYQAASDQGGYVEGILGASLTKTDKIGIVGPIEVGDAKLYVDGYTAGATATNPSLKVNVNYTGSFSDVGLASEAARSFVASGADVMTGTAQMVVGAIGVAKANNVPWFGTQSNQTALAPSIVVASQVYHWEVVLSQIFDQINKGVLGGKTYSIDLKNGGEVIEYNPAFSLPADAKAKADAAIKGIEDGTISIVG